MGNNRFLPSLLFFVVLFVFSGLVLCSPRRGSYYGDLKIYRYPLPDKFNFGLPVEKYATRYTAPSSQYGLEWTLDVLLLSLGPYPSGVLVSDPKEADLFYVPYYSNLVQLNSPTAVSDMEELLRDYVPYLERYRGRDHFFFVSVGWNKFWDPLKKRNLNPTDFPHAKYLGNADLVTLIGSDLHTVFNFSSILVPFPDYACLSDDFQWKDHGRSEGYFPLSSPPFTPLAPKPSSHLPSSPPRLSTSPGNIIQENMPLYPSSLSPNRKYLACFLGSVLKKKLISRQHLQQHAILYEQQQQHSRQHQQQHHQQSYNPSSLPISFTSLRSRARMDINQLISVLGDSYFCLCPPGDTPHTKRLFNALFLGCIPVLITHPLFHFPYPSLPWSTFVIQFNESALIYHTQNKNNYKNNYNTFDNFNGTVTTYPNLPYQNIFDFLAGIPEKRVREMQRRVMQVRKHMVYHWKENRVLEGDAMDLLVRELAGLAKEVGKDKFQYEKRGWRKGRELRSLDGRDNWERKPLFEKKKSSFSKDNQ